VIRSGARGLRRRARTALARAAGDALLILFAARPLVAQVTPQGRVVTDTLWSQALGARKGIVVYLPPSYATNPSRRYPVAYYLHGVGGDETNWTRVGRIDRTMDSLVAAGMPEMIIAMPDGDDSWYATYDVLLDAAGCRRMLGRGGNAEADCVAWPHYDDYIAYDVVRHVDAKYRTLAAREHRALGGLSMGGYGAVMLAVEYPSEFAAAASHSGTLWMREFAPPPLTAKLSHGVTDSTAMASFGQRYAARLRVIFGADSAGWFSRDPAAVIARSLTGRGARPGAQLPALYADGGTDDPFLAQSRAFRDAMAAQGVPLEYHEAPGGHDWVYWSANVRESLVWLAARIAR
jgi:S-formylglutathione hydrolase FrmB